MSVVKPLYNHNSVETSYMVDDYPYGRLRCRIRFWLESDPKKGYRFCSQTEDPKRLIWNNPKKGTYMLLAGCMYLDDKGHVVWSGLSEYSSAEEVRDFITKFSGADMSRLKVWCKKKADYALARAEGKIKWTINGVVQPDSEADVEKYHTEAAIWKDCAARLSEKG